MASIQQEPTGMFHVVVRIEGKRYKRSLQTKIASEAACKRDEIQETIDLIKRNRIQVPDGVRIIDFVMSGGQTPTQKKPHIIESPAPLSMQSLFDQYFESLPNDAIEESTLGTMQIHRRHLLRIFKSSFDVRSLNGKQLQQYVNQRSKENTQFFVDRTNDECEARTQVSATTIKKEIVTLGAIWRWALAMEIVTGPFPNRGIRFPKTQEKPPFQTWDEIERQLRQGGIDPGEAECLWDCLYLRKSEILALLKHVDSSANYPFIYPMFAMAAFTGARRSEIMRARVADFDFEANIVTIRERKRIKGRRSTRRVPVTPMLAKAMTDWFEHLHPGGPAAFSQKKLTDRLPSPITRDQAQFHFRKTVEKSRWEKIKGWHCLRHSFISNLACAGVDQRIIDEFVGHSTEEMRRRYRHLFPNIKHEALAKVFN